MMQIRSDMALRLYQQVMLGIDRPLGDTRARGDDGQRKATDVPDGVRLYAKHFDDELPDAFVATLCTEIAEKKIAGLSLASCRNITDAALADVAKLAHLETLDLFNTAIADLKPLASLAKLSSLNLAGTRVVDWKPIASLKTLEHLHAGFTSIGDTDLDAIAALSSLKTLVLTATRVTDAGMAKLASMSSLETLILDETSVGDDGVRALRPLGKTLLRLGLGYTAITDASVSTFLESFQSLRMLSLRATHVRRDHDAKLKSAMTKLGDVDTGPDGTQEGLIR